MPSFNLQGSNHLASTSLVEGHQDGVHGEQGETERVGSAQLGKEKQKSNFNAIHSYLIDLRVGKRWSQALLKGAAEIE